MIRIQNILSIHFVTPSATDSLAKHGQFMTNDFVIFYVVPPCMEGWIMFRYLGVVPFHHIKKIFKVEKGSVVIGYFLFLDMNGSNEIQT